MKEFGLIAAVLLILGVTVGKVGYEDGYAKAKAEAMEADIKAARKAEASRCIDGVVYNNTNSGYWIQSEKKCKVLP